MLCPGCHQNVPYSPAQTTCALCGFDLKPLQRRCMTIYALSVAFFASAVLYAVIVYVLETSQALGPPVKMPEVLPYVLLVVAVLTVGVAVSILGDRLRSASSSRQVQSFFVVQLALAESICVYGLLIYLLSHSLQWFVTFLTISLLAMVYFNGQLPLIMRKLGEIAAAECQEAAQRRKEDL